MFGGVGLTIVLISFVFLCFFPKVKSLSDDKEEEEFQ